MTQTAAAADYRLGPQDRVRVKVAEWRTDKTEYFDWAIFSGEYAVDASGTIALPLIGNVPAEGRTTNDLAAAIEDTLQKRAGLSSHPEAAVEIAQYRPIYVVGAVERAGEYPYRPSLTVLQAVSIAGGLYRQADQGPNRIERDRLNALGAYENARLDVRRLLVRRERLLAELTESEQIIVPEELREDADTKRLIADEFAVMKARKDALNSQLAANAELKDLFSKEVESLNQKMVVQDRQISIARRERQTVGALVEKGLAVSAREFTLERTLADLESKLLDYATAMLRARQEISKADRDATDLQADRKAKIVAEKQETEASLDQARARLATAQNLIKEATLASPQAVVPQLDAITQTTYSIVRNGNTSAAQSAADEYTAVEPGDVVRVEMTIKNSSLSEQPKSSADNGALITQRLSGN